MSISRRDVDLISNGPGSTGEPLPTAEADRVAAVLNRHRTRGPLAQLRPRTPPDATDTAPDERARTTDARPRRTVPRSQLLAVMARTGYPPEEIEEAAAALPEQVDRRVDHEVLERFSLNVGELMDRMGASP